MNATLIAPATEGTVLDTGKETSIEQRAMEFFNSRMAGQMEAKRAAAAAIRRSVSKLRNKRRPIRSLVFLGPSTTGKTLLASLVAEFLHNDPEALLFIDGSNYMERHQLVNLTGAPKSYVGYVDPKDPKYVPPAEDEEDSYAELSQHNLNRSRKGSDNPTIVMLVDEWEKACREFNNVMLRIARNGKIKLGNGRETTFYNVILIVTGNIGSQAIEDLHKPAMGFGTRKAPSKKDIEGEVQKHLKLFAPPEFRKRIIENGEFIIFEELTRKQLEDITDQQVEALKALMLNNGEVLVQLDVDSKARKWLLDEALSNEGDVANLSGIIESKLTYPLDGQMIEDDVESGDRVEVTHEEGKDELTIRCFKAAMLLGQATGEIDPALVAAISKGQTGSGPDKTARDARVDVDAVRRALVPTTGAERGAKNGAQDKPHTGKSDSEGGVRVIVQDFVLTVRGQSREAIAEARQQVFAALTDVPYVDVTDESYSYDKDTMVQIPGGMMAAKLSVMQLKVVGPIESLYAVKNAVPFAQIDIVAGPLE